MAVTINGAGTITGLTSATLPQVNASTQVLIGGPITSTYTKGLQAFGTSGGANGSAADLMSWRYSADTVGGQLGLYKTRGTTALDTSVPVATNDTLGAVTFYGSTGSGMAAFAAITGFVDGTVNTTPTLATAISITTGSTAATERMRVNSSGEVSIQKSLLVGGPNTSVYAYGSQLYGTAANGSSNAFQWQYSVNTTGASLLFAKTRGASATDLTAAANGDTIGSVSFGGSDGTAIQARGGFTGFIDGAVSAGNVPTAFSITTGTTSGTERMRITSAGLMGIGTGTPASCAIVDVTSTTLGFKFPVMTTTQKNAIAAPVAGLVIFDSTLAKLCVYSGSAWQTITSV